MADTLSPWTNLLLGYPVSKRHHEAAPATDLLATNGRGLVSFIVPLFFGGEGVPIYALLAYSKSDKTDLTRGERRAVAALVAAIKLHGKQGK